MVLASMQCNIFRNFANSFFSINDSYYCRQNAKNDKESEDSKLKKERRKWRFGRERKRGRMQGRMMGGGKLWFDSFGLFFVTAEHKGAKKRSSWNVRLRLAFQNEALPVRFLPAGVRFEEVEQRIQKSGHLRAWHLVELGENGQVVEPADRGEQRISKE